MDLFTITYILLWALVLLQAVVLLVVLRSFGTLFLGTRDAISRDGLSIGTEAPDFTANTGAGDSISLRDFRGRWVVLIFASPTCQICWELIPTLDPLRNRLADHVEFALLLRAERDVAAEYEHRVQGSIRVLSIGKQGTAEQYHVRVSPFVHILDPLGVVRAKGLVNDRDHMEHLLVDAGLEHESLRPHGRDAGATNAMSHAGH